MKVFCSELAHFVSTLTQRNEEKRTVKEDDGIFTQAGSRDGSFLQKHNKDGEEGEGVLLIYGVPN